jgi:hypothetical protein
MQSGQSATLARKCAVSERRPATMLEYARVRSTATKVRSNALSAPDFPETRQKPKTGNKNNANLNFLILSIQKHEINKIIAQLK